jgi:hypothetical protein
MSRVVRTAATALERPIYLWTIAGMAVVFAYLALLVRLMSQGSYNEWGGLVIAPVLVAISIPLLIRLTRSNGDQAMTGVIIAGLLLKLGGALARYFVVFAVYGGNDSVAYHEWGEKLAPLIRSGNFAPTIPVRLLGTGFIEVFTGWVYAFTGPTIVGGYLIFSWLGFWGLYLFYRAFRIAFPEGDHRRYALLLFFLPSLLFWSSSIGKEAWMTFTLGLFAYGSARLLAHHRGGLPIVLLGILGTIMVRPHVALVAFLALFAAYIVRPPKRPTITSPIAKVGGIIVLVVVGFLVLSQVQNFFGVQKLDSGSVDTVLARTTTQSTQGGSEFTVEQVNGPIGFVNATVAVVFRPWPFEAHNAMAALASLEGVFLAVMFALSIRRLARLPSMLFRVPYVMFATVFSVGFIFAFASVGNFGIMVRQRVQLYPFLFVILALPAVAELRGSRSRATARSALRAGGRPRTRIRH